MSAFTALSLPPAFDETRQTLLAKLVDGLDGPALWWLSGYAAGLAHAAAPLQKPAAIHDPAAAVQAGATQRLTIVYGSQTGNAKRTAEELARQAEAAGLEARLLRADAYPTRELAGERLLYVVISTQGEGDPPDDAIGLVEFLAGKRAPKLPELRYAVLGLGDSSYADFCGIARRIDARLAELGAHRVQALCEADIDVETVAAPWREQALAKARQLLAAPTPQADALPLRTPAHAAAMHSRDRPFAAELLANQPLSGREFKGTGFRAYRVSDKDVRHLEISLEGSGLSYEPGDALGVWPRNSDALIDAVLSTLKLDGDAAVAIGEEPLPLRQWLANKRELTKLSRPFIAALAEHADTGVAAELRGLLEPAQSAALAALLGEHQLIDALRRWPSQWNAETLVAALRPLTPRLYSIASSRKRVGEEAHLTVDVLHYHAHGFEHSGSASGFLAAQGEGAQVPVFIEANERFRVPADGSRDIVMIGPGTGVAPFRGFVQERAETGARGRNWLLFGARHFDTGFLYQTEWQQALQRGELHRLDVAFSRDQAQRIHVQDRLREHGRELYDWLQNGAHLYVCGAIGMGKDVHAALLDVIAAHNGGNADHARDFVATLQREGRYSRDTY